MKGFELMALDYAKVRDGRQQLWSKCETLKSYRKTLQNQRNALQENADGLHKNYKTMLVTTGLSKETMIL